MAIRVTRVTVEYATTSGQRFSIDFDPDNVKSIVFSKQELQVTDKGALPVLRKFVEFDTSIPFKKNDFSGTTAMATSVLVGAAQDTVDPNEEERGLWWWTGTTWFHPKT